MVALGVLSLFSIVSLAAVIVAASNSQEIRTLAAAYPAVVTRQQTSVERNTTNHISTQSPSPSRLTISRPNTPATTTISPTHSHKTPATAVSPTTSAPTASKEKCQVSTATECCKAFLTQHELYSALDIYLARDAVRRSNEPALIPSSPLAVQYGLEIGDWDVSRISNFTSCFDTRRNENATYFNSDISKWNVSSATTMRRMFSSAASFDQDLSPWDVSMVTDMSSMFRSTPLNQPLDSWDVSNVVDFSYMFYGNSKINTTLNSWDVSKAEDMSFMFKGAKVFNRDISSWNVVNVRSMRSMFESFSYDSDDSAFNCNVEYWNTANVEDMTHMFAGAQWFNQPLGDWDVGLLKNMEAMLSGTEFNHDISSWSVFNVEICPIYSGSLHSTKASARGGPQLRRSTGVVSAFESTHCPDQSNPNLSVAPPGPFCHSCA